MEMVSLFFKIFFACICLTFLWFCLKKSMLFVRPILSSIQSSKIFTDLIKNDIYDKLTINRSIKFYIPPKCQGNHPFEEKQRKQPVKKTDLTKSLDTFLGYNQTCRNLLILGASGMGKTSFALNYFLHNMRRLKKNRHKIVLVSLGTNNADNLILSHSDKKSSVLFIDGLDEDTKALENRAQRIRQLIEISQKYKRLVITSNLNFFPKDKNMPRKKGYERIGSGNIKKNSYSEFKTVYLSPFNFSDIKKYMQAHFSIWDIGTKKRSLSFIKEDAIFRMNPFLLSHLKEIFRDKTAIQSMNDMYKKIIENWISREHNWEDKPLLNLFVHRLAVELYLRREDRGMESITQKDLIKKAEDWRITLLPLANNEKSLICQSQSGLVNFSHRSVMEYLFIERLMAGDKSCYQKLLTQQMAAFLLKALENKNPQNLIKEFDWLSQFELKAHGLTIKQSNDSGNNQKDLFSAILRKNPQFKFLGRLRALILNPIFFEFGWDPKLNRNLRSTVHQRKTTLMKVPEKELSVIINPNKIELIKKDKERKKILFNEKDFRGYNNLSNNFPMTNLTKAMGLKGLILFNNINQSKNFCVLPDLKTFKRFTLYFWSK
ncbi:MAG: hypothetical protein GY699_03215 [Desulfobacteraceae bacterium]|nr:hypothetical protein [Desulfobacteraceae bacterium]